MKADRPLSTLLCCLWLVGESVCVRPETNRPGEQTGNRVRAIAELNWREVDALNREKTLFLLTVGMLEEHGPHLPIAADTIGVEYEVRAVANILRDAPPDWQVVLMPTVNYGASGANQISNVTIHPGTYAVRQSTLRSLVAISGRKLRRTASSGSS